MPLLKDPILNLQQRLTRSFYKIKRSCLRMETDGKLKLQRISDRRAFTVDYSDD
ncbi:hypothetical protein CsSME_00009391 [Camellia sinensis var. sinensis]